MPRLSRAARSAETRASVLAAAGELFRRRGFHAASLEEIADHAGFSKGVIYSQFGGKDDLMLALIEDYIGVRAGRVLDRLRSAPKGSELSEMWQQARQDRESDVAWELLIVEFRVHAARDPDLNRRFGRLHVRRLDAAATVFQALEEKTGLRLPYAAADFARLISAIDAGGLLERLIEGPGDSYDVSRDAVLRLLESGRE